MVTSDTRVKIDATALKNAVQMYRSEYQAQARADLFTGGQTRGVLKATSDILAIIENLEATTKKLEIEKEVTRGVQGVMRQTQEHITLLEQKKQLEQLRQALQADAKQHEKKHKKKHKGAKHE